MISNDTTTNIPRYVTFLDKTSGNLTSIYVSDTKLQFNPQTGALSAGGFVPTSATLPDIGMSLSINGGLALVTNYAERLQIDVSGHVGIGGAPNGDILHVNGSFSALSKSFLIDHPTQSGRQLRYASLEGPENGVYLRGRLTGNNQIDLPEYWSSLVDISTVTVSLTPVTMHQELFVANINSSSVTIGTSHTIVDCFYTIYAERRDIPRLVVES